MMTTIHDIRTVDDLKERIACGAQALFEGRVDAVAPYFSEGAKVTVLDEGGGPVFASFAEMAAFIRSFGPSKHGLAIEWGVAGLDGGLAWARFDTPLPATPAGRVLCVWANTEQGWRVVSLVVVRVETSDLPIAA